MKYYIKSEAFPTALNLQKNSGLPEHHAYYYNRGGHVTLRPCEGYSRLCYAKRVLKKLQEWNDHESKEYGFWTFENTIIGIPDALDDLYSTYRNYKFTVDDVEYIMCMDELAMNITRDFARTLLDDEDFDIFCRKQ